MDVNINTYNSYQPQLVWEFVLHMKKKFIVNYNFGKEIFFTNVRKIE